MKQTVVQSSFSFKNFHLKCVNVWKETISKNQIKKHIKIPTMSKSSASYRDDGLPFWCGKDNICKIRDCVCRTGQPQRDCFICEWRDCSCDSLKLTCCFDCIKHKSLDKCSCISLGFILLYPPDW